MKNILKFGRTAVKVKVSCKCSDGAHHGVGSVKPGKNLIRILESFVMLPAIALSMPFGGLVGVASVNTQHTAPIVAIANIQPEFSIAGITRSFGLNKLAENDDVAEAEEAKIKMIEIRGAAIDLYFKSKAMPLLGTGKKMVEEAEKNGIDWRLIPAISVRESTGGKFACKSVTHSYFGWGSCKINFNSKDAAIESIARNLGGNNPNTNHHYPKGATLERILKRYNSVIPAYTNEVFKIMNTIGDKNLGKPIETTTITKEAAV